MSNAPEFEGICDRCHDVLCRTVYYDGAELCERCAEEAGANDCPACGGSGGGDGFYRCTRCMGSGKVESDLFDREPII